MVVRGGEEDFEVPSCCDGSAVDEFPSIGQPTGGANLANNDGTRIFLHSVLDEHHGEFELGVVGSGGMYLVAELFAESRLKNDMASSFLSRNH